ncbi:MAG: haloacid dehalogenase type II [Gammaproteobacteria bacterium]|nr:haloacid dehalogenase type II [Gammaproteobacteria bacterium]MBI5615072.1 haloacid dehalogenase type II [Gammaproteobacteria bacterium]
MPEIVTPPALVPGPNRSPPRGTRPIRAFFFDTYGTVCDFLQPLSRALAGLATREQLALEATRLAIAWRTAYIHATAARADPALPFVPLRAILADCLGAVLRRDAGIEPSAAVLDELAAVWHRLEPWPDAVPGLHALKAQAVIAPLSNGNLADMTRLARHAGLPWDVILGSSIARCYKPHPHVYLESAAALGLPPGEVCMVAAHQFDLHFAAGVGMQTAFVSRPQEFGGPTRPRVLAPGVDHSAAAEVFAEADWTYVATDFLDLAAQTHDACAPL